MGLNSDTKPCICKPALSSFGVGEQPQHWLTLASPLGAWGGIKYLSQVLYSVKTSCYFAACLGFQLHSLAARKALILLTNTSHGSIPCGSSEQPQARWLCHPHRCQAQVTVPLAELCGWFWSFLFCPHLYNSSSISALHAWFLNCSLRLISVSYIHSCLGL